MKKEGNQAIVVFAIGDKYFKEFSRTFRPSFERYARKISIPLIISEKQLQETTKHPSWQKLLVFKHPTVSQCEKIMIIDGDMYITKHAQNIFSVCANVSWAACRNNAYNLSDLAKSDLDLYRFCSSTNRPNFVVNCGMFIISHFYKDSIEKIFKEQKEQTCYEQGPLSYFLINQPGGKILPPEFNTIVSSYVDNYGCSLSSILKMYQSASFLHFAASKWRSIFYFIRWLDTTESEFLKKCVFFCGKKRFDFLTSRMFKLFERFLGVYNYRVKRLFSK